MRSDTFLLRLEPLLGAIADEASPRETESTWPTAYTTMHCLPAGSTRPSLAVRA